MPRICAVNISSLPLYNRPPPNTPTRCALAKMIEACRHPAAQNNAAPNNPLSCLARSPQYGYRLIKFPPRCARHPRVNAGLPHNQISSHALRVHHEPGFPPNLCTQVALWNDRFKARYGLHMVRRRIRRGTRPDTPAATALSASRFFSPSIPL